MPIKPKKKAVQEVVKIHHIHILAHRKEAASEQSLVVGTFNMYFN